MSPTRALMAKDLRELLPWAFLCFALGLLDFASELLEQPDMRPLGVTIESLHGAGSVMMWLIAFAIGTGLGAREQDEGTLAFLDGLPVSRAHVLAVKVVVTLGMLLIAPTVSLAVVTQLHVLSRGSLDFAFEAHVLLACYALQAGFIAQGLILGTALGFLRSLTWLVSASIGIGLSVLTKRVPRAAFLNPFSLLDAELTPRGIELSSVTLAVQVGLTLLAAACAALLFMRAGRRSRLDLTDKPKLKALVTTGTLIALLGAFGLWGKRMSESQDDDQDTETSYVSGASEQPAFRTLPAQTSTVHYRISYPSEQATAALALAARADATFERVHALLRVAPTGVIDVDASGSMQNTEGTAFFGRLRLRLGPDARATLAHETAHVVAQRVVGQARTEHWKAASTLDEGLATWVERRLDEPGEQVAAGDAGLPAEGPAAEAQLLLAALHTRRELSIEELADPAALEAHRDGNLKYPAGEALIAALVRLYGVDAIPRLLRAFGDTTLASDLQNLALWQAVFQRAHLDLGRVTDEMLREIAAYAELHAEAVAALPRPRVRVVENEEGLFGVQGFLDAVEPAHDANDAQAPRRPRLVSLRFKPDYDSGLDDYEHAMVTDGRASFRDPDAIQDERICVQPGVPFAGGTLYEPWVCLPTAGAARWDPPQTEQGSDDELE